MNGATAEAAVNETALGENVRVSEEGEDIVIRIKKDVRGGLSESGKTIRVGSTLGNKEFNGVVIGLNAYVYAKPKAKKG
jgi:hypothetical protein